MFTKNHLFRFLKKITLLIAVISIQAVNAQDSIIANPLPAKYAALERYNRDIRFVSGEDTVIAICTGYISTDKAYPEPVFVWLIKSPAGNYLVDGGLSPLICDKAYFKGISKMFFEREFTFFVYPVNYLPAHLRMYGVAENNLKAIFLTHAHFDHIGYLDHFKKTKVILTGEEKKQVQGKGQLAGYQEGTERIVNFDRCDPQSMEGLQIKKFSDSISLIRTGEHTDGHQMILVKTSKENLLFTGDINLSKCDPKSPLPGYLNTQSDFKNTRLFFNHDQYLKAW